MATQTRRMPRSRPSSSPSLTTDQRRYHLFRTGVSAEEQAARENVTLPTIRASIERQSVLASTFSNESLLQSARSMLLDQMPGMALALSEAAEAVIELKKEEVHDDGRVTESSYFVPDHSVRLKAIKAFESLLGQLQPKSPLLAIDARSQTQINNPAPSASSAQTLSTESIIRQIRADRGMALGDGSSGSATVMIPTVMPQPTAVPVFVERDEELDPVEEGELIDADTSGQ